MKTLTTDVAVIGAGTAGMSAWRAARAHTPNVLLIERAQYGTTCARSGCMPSKLMIAAAEAAHTIEHSGVFGVHGGGLRVDGEAVMARVRAERDRFVGFVVEAVEGWPVEHRLMGHARFVGPQALQVQTADGPVQVQAGRTITYRATLQPQASQDPGEVARPDVPAERDAAGADPAPVPAAATFYVIPGCYMGNVPPAELSLPSSCDARRAVVVRP